MFKHHKKLKRLWNKTHRIKKGHYETLDMRYNTSKAFKIELLRILDREVRKLPQGSLEIVETVLKD